MSITSVTHDDEVNTAAAVKFLKKWPAPPVLTAIHVDQNGKKGRVETRAFGPNVGDWALVMNWIDERQGKANLYFSPNVVTTQNKKAEKADVQGVVAFHVDCDARVGEPQLEARDRIAAKFSAYDPPPSVINFSGGGCQAFWILEAPIEIGGDVAKAQAAELYNKKLIAELDGDIGTHNVDRIMRLPHTTNLPDERKLKKGRVPMLAEVIDDNFARHAIEKFESATADKEPDHATSTAIAIGVAPPITKVERDQVVWDRLPRLNDLQELYRWGVDHWALMNVALGDEAIVGNDELAVLHDAHVSIGHRVEEGPYKGKRSDALWATLKEFARCDVPVELAIGVITDRRWGISACVFDKKDARREALKQINKAYGEVAAEAQKRRTGPNRPRWHETYDTHGLFPKGTYRNARVAIQHLGIVCRCDDFHKKVLVGYEGEAPHAISPLVGELSEAATTRLRQVIADRYDFDAKEPNVYQAMLSLAFENVFDPVLDYFDEVQGRWDGKPRLDSLAIDYLGSPNTELNKTFLRIMLIATVRRVRDPGCKFDQICVLEGVEGTNKSSFIATMAGAENFSDQRVIGERDREVQEQLGGVLMHEMADLTGMKKADVETIKAFASRTHDRARPAWGRMLVRAPRRCTQWATTNDTDYLQSQTGNRRFWPVPTARIDIDKVRCDRDQLWGEAAAREAKGESIVLEERMRSAAGEAQDQRREVDPWEDLLATAVEAKAEYEALPEGNHDDKKLVVSSVRLMGEVLALQPKEQTGSQGRRLSRVMKRLDWSRGFVYVNTSVPGEQPSRTRLRGYFRAVAEPKISQ